MAAPIPRVPPLTTATRAMSFIPSVFDSARLYVVNLRRAKNCRSPRDGQRDAHAAADAKRGEALFYAAALHFVQKRGEDPGAGRADRMADGDRPAVGHVQTGDPHYASRNQLYPEAMAIDNPN